MIAAVAATALLVAALAGVSGAERRVAEVGIFAASDSGSNGVGPHTEVEGADIEILEYGFGLIELNGWERLTVGAVVRNPSPTAFANLLFEVTADSGETLVDSFRSHDIPPGSDALIGGILTDADTAWADAELELTVEEASSESSGPPTLPERFTVVEVEPLLFPQGQRIVYRIESEFDGATGTRPDVVFRDADGAIVGGVGGEDHVVDGADGNSSIPVPPGTSVHHFNLRSEEIPAGADLLQTEIGPGGVIPGG
ncbi:hypothetical protein [Glycomyces arizonensis]|uniref:hypothetical protein n=1 Tax=Glycomyces arizonensis TaxID=256035 RepID=UPI0012EB1867|nr:hypothetical protein [Glycomyces arizonensis]